MPWSEGKSTMPAAIGAKPEPAVMNWTDMRVAIIGAGPAGLFFSLLLKRKRPQDDVVVIEQNPRDATFGFGVVFSRGALEFFARDAPEMHARLSSAMESWSIQRIVHRDQAVDVDGNGF